VGDFEVATGGGFWVAIRAMLFASQTMVSKAEKILSFVKTAVSGIETMVCVRHTIFTTTEATVTDAQKMASVAR